MTRFIEIMNNTLIVKKQVLEQQLEETINSKKGKVEKRVDKGISILEEISTVTNTIKILENYINNNNN
tara:strand:+ start:278 stop:481 length:204 start_codon:yes stop_codon:yes gene_type:complete